MGLVGFFEGLILEIFNGNNFYMTFMFFAGFIAFIVTLVIYLFKFKKYKDFQQQLIRVRDEENSDIRIEEINEWFKNQKKSNVLKNIWDRYYNEYDKVDNETIPDPLYYFNTDELVNKAGHRKLIEIIPASFVSLGLLGTFIAIVMGISDLDTTAGSEALSMGIDNLLSSMAFAFYSSVLGMLISLGYQLVDRAYFYKGLQTEADNLLIELDKTIPIETESSLLEKLAKVQETQMNDMKTFFTDKLLPDLTSGISDSISNAITPQLEKSNEIMDRVANQSADAQSESLNEMVNHFVSSLNDITGNQIEELGNALHKTVEWQEKVHQEMNELVTELSNVAQEQADMAKKTTELSEQMNIHTEQLANYQDTLSNATTGLEAVTEENTNLLDKMNETYEQLTEKQQEENQLLDQRMTTMNEMLENLTNVGSSFTEMNIELKQTIETIVDTTGNLSKHAEENQQLTETLMKQHEVSNQWSVKTHELLEDVSQNINLTEELQETLQSLYQTVADERTNLNEMQSQYSDTLTTSVHKLAQLWNENQNLMSESQSQLSELNNDLGSSMESFAEHMQRGVQGTFEQFDKQLKKAIDHLDRGVTSIASVIDALEEGIGDLDGQFKRLNGNLQEINTEAGKQVVVNE